MSRRMTEIELFSITSTAPDKVEVGPSDEIVSWMTANPYRISGR